MENVQHQRRNRCGRSKGAGHAIGLLVTSALATTVDTSSGAYPFIEGKHTIGVIGKIDLDNEIGAGKNQPVMV